MSNSLKYGKLIITFTIKHLVHFTMRAIKEWGQGVAEI